MSQFRNLSIMALGIMSARTAFLVTGAAIALLLGSAQASAAIMTFKDLPSGFLSETYQENGITMTSGEIGGFGGVGSFDLPESQHLDDSGTSWANAVTFTMDRRFNAIFFDVNALNNDLIRFFHECDPDCSSGPIPHNNVKVQGIRDEAVTAELNFFMGEEGSVTRVNLARLFRNLDALVISAVLPDCSAGSPETCFVDELSFAQCVDAPCAHFNIDNVRLNPVPVVPAQMPVPAALPLMAAALAGLGFLGWRRRLREAGRT